MTQSIQQYLGVPSHWKVKENIKHAILLMPSTNDIKTAKKRDPKACALHNTACRQFGIPTCAIGPRYSFIPQRDSKGKYYIARMAATKSTERAIRIFDQTGKMPLAGFQFIPISKAHTYKNKAAYNKKYSAGIVEQGGPGSRPDTKNPPRKKIVTRSIPYIKAA